MSSAKVRTGRPKQIYGNPSPHSLYCTELEYRAAKRLIERMREEERKKREEAKRRAEEGGPFISLPIGLLLNLLNDKKQEEGET